MSNTVSDTYTYISDEHRAAVEQALRDPRGPRPGLFASTHSHLVDAAYIDLHGTRYTRNAPDGRPVEVWHKTSDGWVDVTAAEQLRWNIAQRTAEVRAAEQRQLIDEAKAILAARHTEEQER